MKKTMKYTCLGAGILLLLGSCAKDAPWNQNGEVPEDQKATILGQLINDDDNQPLKGVKILVERQTSAKGGQTFVDTVDTDAEGTFSYQLPFPNKVKLSVRDTLRYAKSEHTVEVYEHKAYPVTMNSHPKFGDTDVVVDLKDENGQILPGLKVGLSVRESSDEPYSLVEILTSDDQGRATFTHIAFPVHYKVELQENPLAYEAQPVEGQVLERSPVNITLTVQSLFSVGDIMLQTEHFLNKKPMRNEHFSYRYKSILEDDFGPLTAATFDAQGQFLLQSVSYPGEVRIESNGQSAVRFVVDGESLEVGAAHTSQPLVLRIKDLEPRYAVPVLTNLKVSTLILNNGVTMGRPFAVTMDNNHNLYIGDGGANAHKLIMVDPSGNASVIAGTGAAGNNDGPASAATFNGMWGVAVDSSGNIYTTDAANANGAHRIRKIAKNGNGGYVVSTIAGTGAAGSNNGPGASATFERPSGILYDHARNCLYVSEWGTGSRRIRKIDLSGTDYPVTTLAVAPAFNLFAMALSPDGNDLYVSSNNNSNIFRYDFATNQISPYQNSGLNNRGLFVAGDKLLATAGNGHQVFYYDLTTNVKTELASGAGDFDGRVITNVPIEDQEARFRQPFGIHYDKWSGIWYVANNTNSDAAGYRGTVRMIVSDDL